MCRRRHDAGFRARILSISVSLADRANVGKWTDQAASTLSSPLRRQGHDDGAIFRRLPSKLSAAFAAVPDTPTFQIGWMAPAHGI